MGFEPLGVKQIWVKIPALPLHGWGLSANEILYLLGALVPSGGK